MQHNKTILLIDDNPDYLKTGKEKIERCGYNCLIAEDLKNALLILKADKNKVALIILDMILPKDKDSDAWKDNVLELKSPYPDIHILISSGEEGVNEKILRNACKYDHLVSGGFFKPKVDPKSKIDEWKTIVIPLINDILDSFELRISTPFLWNYLAGYHNYTKVNKDEEPKSIDFYNVICKLGEKYIINKTKPEFEQGTEIYDVLENSHHIDWLLKITNKRYRNHFEHQFNVAALGWFLLHVEVKPHMPLKELCYVEAGKDKNWKEEDLFRSWWIASLLHDHGYPLAYLLNTSYARQLKPIEALSNSLDIVTQINDNFESLYQEIICKKLEPFLDKFNKEKLESIIGNELSRFLISPLTKKDLKSNIYDHGILGAFNLVNKIKEAVIDKSVRVAIDKSVEAAIDKSVEAAIDKSVEAAIQAICFHNLKLDFKISFKEYPILFLLILCDTLQEWGRPLIVNNESYTELNEIVLKLKRRVEGKEIFSFPSRLQIEFNYSNYNSLKKTKWDYVKFMESLNEGLGRLQIPFGDEFKPSNLDVAVSVVTNIV